MSTRWTDDFLDGLRQQGDWKADQCLSDMISDGEIAHASELFQYLDFNSEEALINRAEFPAIRAFFDATCDLPSHTDRERIRRAEDLFSNHLYPAALVMLCSSLPSGYAAKCLSDILNLSGSLEHHPFRRLMGVMQMVLNATVNRGLAPQGSAIITAQKVRLLHAGIRHIADHHLPDYRAQYGVPVNHEDMLATVMGFSYLIIVGLRRLGIRLSSTEEEDLFYLWRVFALTMGIHPKDEPESFDYIPDNVDDAQAFYNKYAQRQFVPAAENPIGVQLARANVKMIQDLVPKSLRGITKKSAQIYSYDLIGAQSCACVGIHPVRGHKILRWTLYHVLPLTDSLSHHNIAFRMFQHMITEEYDGRFKFWLPDTMQSLKEMNEEPKGEQ